MNQGSRYWYSWIVAQLVAVRSLEVQLTDSLASGAGRKTNDVRRRMVELQLRVELLERALECRFGRQILAKQALGPSPRALFRRAPLNF